MNSHPTHVSIFHNIPVAPLGETDLNCLDQGVKHTAHGPDSAYGAAPLVCQTTGEPGILGALLPGGGACHRTCHCIGIDSWRQEGEQGLC